MTFEQTNTPDTIGVLGNGDTHGGATFSSGGPTRITSSVGFGAASVGPGGVFNPVTDWVDGLSLGQLGNTQAGLTQSDGTGSHFSSAVNLPNGNNGTSTRHGLSVSWSSGFGVENGTGGDFVVYESGSPGSPEGFMVRVELSDGTFTDWYYQPNSGFEAYVGSSDGAFATVFDLSDLGVAAGGIATTIQIANLISTDFLSSLAGGSVNFSGVGVPQPFAGGSLDPDPLYVGVISTLTDPNAVSPPQVVPEPASLGVWSLVAGTGAVVGWRRRRRNALRG